MNQRVDILPWAAVAAAGLMMCGCGAKKNPAGAQVPVSIEYPEVARGDHVDEYHGTRVADPYRWLEALDSPETAAFVEAQNTVSRPYLDALPGRERIKTLLTGLWNYERYGLPVKEGGRYFYTRNDGLQNQSVIYVANALDAEPRELLDPNTLSADGTVALAGWRVSPDGKLLAYATSDGGTDWKTWRFRDVQSGRDLDEEIRHVKFTEVSWLPGSDGFYYSRYPLDADGRADDSKQAEVYLHRMGTAQDEDRHVYAITHHPRYVPYATVTEDGRFLIIDVFGSYSANAIYYFDLHNKQAEPVRLFDDWQARYEFLGNRGTELMFSSTRAAPNARVIAVDVGAGKPKLREIVPEAAEVLTGASYVGGRIFAQYLQDARSRVRMFALDGSALGEVRLPGAGAAGGFGGHPHSTETFFSYADFLTPAVVYRFEIEPARAQVFRQPKITVDTSRYITEQVFYASRDGTRVPMFITRRPDAPMDGSNPVRLDGYGGFNAAQTPRYSPQVIAWLELGGIYASANLRGGSEYGEAWHEAGTRLRKQNVFDDFIAAAEWLIEKKYTSSSRLAVSGASNGGLLVAAVINQRPELFGAALPDVGVLDMLRYHTASANAYQWSSEYGLSEVAGEFAALYAYSPYHNTRPGACYPPTLITTADHDDRVVPWHSYKFGAALQHAQGCDNPVLLTVETRAGHGAGKPTWKQIEEVVDSYAFLGWHLGMALK
jgi:prolyl oligopeptidase